MYDYCKHVNVFYGNGETDRFITDGIASKWFYIKAQCGNTNPNAVLPFGKTSVGAYSGGYPTGYGTHYPNSCGGIRKISEKMKIRGFSHLHQTGVGGIGYYYNYAIVTPYYNNLAEIYNYSEISNERAKPGYYACNFNNVSCEFTVTNSVAYHKYKFNNGGKIAVDFSNDGLSKFFEDRFYGVVKDGEIKLIDNKTATFSGVFSGVKLYFAITIDAKNVTASIFDGESIFDGKVYDTKNLTNGYGVTFSFNGNDAEIKFAYSTVSELNAINDIIECNSKFLTVKECAYGTWNYFLSKIDVETDNDKLKEKFYSNLYHSIIKPTYLKGESLYGVENGVLTDVGTFWDVYKTVFPLIFLLYKNMGENVVKSIKNISEKFGKLPCSLGLSNIFRCEEQAKMLAVYVMIDAYRYGVKNADVASIEKVFKTELNRDDYSKFIESGYFERYTHILDVTDACLYLSEITNDEELKNLALNLAKNWKNAYGNDGLMSENSPYYEGDKYTYSFRLQKNINERINLVGGVNNFEKLLDNFFGFNKESVTQIRNVEAYEEIDSKKYHRFEGFNNECDMETPYAYIYANNHDKLCEIINACVNKSFGLGVGGLPGNNDSGGLSSCFIFNALGIFPVTGSDTYLVGTPSFNKATIKLFNDKTLTIIAENKNTNNYLVDSVYVNDVKVENFKINVSDIINGGNITFKMKN